MIKKILLLSFFAVFLVKSVTTEPVGMRYIALYQKLALGKDITQDVQLLFSETITKISNATVICSDRQKLLRQLRHFHATDKLKKVTLQELVQTDALNVIRFCIEYEDGEVDTVIALLRYNQEGVITEINQVFGLKGAYTYQE